MSCYYPRSVVGFGKGTVSLVFTDLVASTATREAMGEDRYEALRREHFESLREAAARANGREVKNLGDGLMLAFRSASDAVQCAVDIQRPSTRHRTPERQRLGVRVGLHTGD